MSDILLRLRIAFLFYFGFPNLWLLWPQGISRGMIALLSPLRYLSSFEYWTRPYYEHISLNFKTVGRFGYVWEEALGAPFGGRIYNNYITYCVFGFLSPRAFRLLTSLSYVGTIIGLAIYLDRDLFGLILALLVIGSPTGLHSLVGCLIKPEVPWWSLSLIAATAAMSGYWALALFVFGILCLANSSVAVISSLFIGSIWLYDGLTIGFYPGGLNLIWLAPGALKNVMRIVQSRTSGMEHEVVVEQNKQARRKLFSIREFFDLALWLGIPYILCGLSKPEYALVISFLTTIVVLTNDHLVKFADTVTIRLLVLSMLISLTLASGAWLGLLGVASFVYYRPFTNYPAIVGRQAAEIYHADLASTNETRLDSLQTILRNYPWFTHKTLPTQEIILSLLAQIPDSARVILESDGDARGGGSYLYFRNWADSQLVHRHVELVNQFFLLRMLEPMLANLYLDNYNAKILQPCKMRKLSHALGASHVLAFSQETISAFTSSGFRKLGSIHADQIEAFTDSLHMPRTDIVLFSTPYESSLIEPVVEWKRVANIISWEACAGVEYLIRYRYNHNFSAWQGNKQIRVHPAQVIDGLPLRFMRLRASADGMLQLKFKQS